MDYSRSGGKFLWKENQKTAEEIKERGLSEAKKPKLPEQAFFLFIGDLYFRFFAQERQPRKEKNKRRKNG